MGKIARNGIVLCFRNWCDTYRSFLESMRKVTGPSFVRFTCICAPKWPVENEVPEAARLSMNKVYSSRALSGISELSKEGRRPFLQSEERVN